MNLKTAMISVGSIAVGFFLHPCIIFIAGHIRQKNKPTMPNCYNSYYNKPPKSRIDTNDSFNNPCFQSRKDAEKFLAHMKSYNYPTLSVHTMYMMRGLCIDYKWDVYGWSMEEIEKLDPEKIIVRINNTNLHWMLDLPKAHLLSR